MVIKKIQQKQAPMIRDPYRNNPLFESIRQTVKPGDVVVDLGAGLGILSFEAIKAGAKKVYAIECHPEMALFGKKEIERRGLKGKIEWISKLSYEAELPELADVLIQETIGSLGFEENFLSALQDAKKRFLKPNAKIIPASITLYGAPVKDCIMKEGTWRVQALRPEQLLAKPKKLITIDSKKNDTEKLDIQAEWKVSKNEKISSIALWPEIVWMPGQITDASPEKPLTHWKQAIVSSKKPSLHLRITPNPVAPRTQTEILWK